MTPDPLKQHPLSKAFPEMSSREQEDLTDDIRVNSQRHDIIMLDGMVLDGWHRAKSCAILGREPLTASLAVDIDPVAYVQSVNLHRRHLTGSQRAAAVTACQAWAESGDNQHTRGGEPGAPPTVKEMAKVAEVSTRTIQQTKRAQEAGLGDAIRDGMVTAKQGAELAKLSKPERQAAMDAPKAPRVPPGPDDRDARIECLEHLVKEKDFELKELRDHLAGIEAILTNSQEELARKDLILGAADIPAAIQKELKAQIDLGRTLQSQQNSQMIKISELEGQLKSARRKIERLEREVKGAPNPATDTELDCNQCPYPPEEK